MGDMESAAALAIIQQWSWECLEADLSGPVPYWRRLSKAMNKLAFEGHADPVNALLHLLIDDQLIAEGSYLWRACRNGIYFSQQDYNIIPINRWRSLRDGLAERDWLTEGKITLPLLDLINVLPAELDWNSNCFSTARKNGNYELFDNYSEEWFSVSDIRVYCPSAPTLFPECDKSSPLEDDDCQRHKPAVPKMGHSRGRPPKYDWEGALAHVAAVANTPDGLKTGPGAQATIERLIADYFMQASDDGSTPCVSEIRKRASRVMWAMADLESSLSKVA